MVVRSLMYTYAALVAAFVADYLHLIERWSEFAVTRSEIISRTDALSMTDHPRHIDRVCSKANISQ